MKITIHTPIGSFTGNEILDVDKENLQEYATAFKRGQLNNFTMKSEDKEYFFPEKVLENSVFVIED